jgi:hypothetical protein
MDVAVGVSDGSREAGVSVARNGGSPVSVGALDGVPVMPGAQEASRRILMIAMFELRINCLACFMGCIHLPQGERASFPQ